MYRILFLMFVLGSVSNSSTLLAQELIELHSADGSRVEIPAEALPELYFTVNGHLRLSFTVEAGELPRISIIAAGTAGEIAVRFHSEDFEYNPVILRGFHISKQAEETKLRRFRAFLKTRTTALGAEHHTFRFAEAPLEATRITVFIASMSPKPSVLRFVVE